MSKRKECLCGTLRGHDCPVHLPLNAEPDEAPARPEQRAELGTCYYNSVEHPRNTHGEKFPCIVWVPSQADASQPATPKCEHKNRAGYTCVDCGEKFSTLPATGGFVGVVRREPAPPDATPAPEGMRPIEPIGALILDHPKFAEWIESGQARQMPDGLWLHYAAICTLLASLRSQLEQQETKLLSAQLWIAKFCAATGPMDEFDDYDTAIGRIKEFRGQLEQREKDVVRLKREIGRLLFQLKKA